MTGSGGGYSELSVAGDAGGITGVSIVPWPLGYDGGLQIGVSGPGGPADREGRVKVTAGVTGRTGGVDASGTGVGVTGKSGIMVVKVTVTDSPGPPGSVAVKVSVTESTGDMGGATGGDEAGGSGHTVISVGPLGGVMMTGVSTGADETGGGGGGGEIIEVGGSGPRLLGGRVKVLPGASVTVRVGPDNGAVLGADGTGGGIVLRLCGGIGAVMVIS